MSAHEGVSCDACGKSNFRSKRYKCLICYDYDLCSNCYEQGKTSSNHSSDHAMQCILTRQDFDLYYQGERYTSDQAQSLTCPFCAEMGFAYPFSNDSSENIDLFHHLQSKHADEQQSSEIICPICASMSNGEPNMVTADLIAHIANDHHQQPQQVQTPSTAGIGSNPYSRQSSSSSNREFDFTSARAGFRRGPLRTPSRRGGLGRGGGIVSQHFLLDSSTSSNGGGNGNDPIADLLTQLSTVRRLAAANNNNSSSSSNPVTLQNLTRQQYERERLRPSGRSQPAPSAVETDFFDSLFSSALLIEPVSSSNSSQQTWAQIVAQPPPPPPPSEPISSSTIKPSSTNEPDPSLLRRFCTNDSPPSTQLNHQHRRKNDFVHSLLLTSLLSSFNHQNE